MTRSSAPAPSVGVAPGVVLALTPARTLVLREAPDADPIDPAAAERIGAALGRGAGHGLLQLGAAEVDTPLPSSVAFWRDVGRAFVARLCAQPELEASRKRLHLPFPEADLASLAAGAPPMPGGEYLDAGDLWKPAGNDNIQRKQEEIRRASEEVQRRDKS